MYSPHLSRISSENLPVPAGFSWTTLSVSVFFSTSAASRHMMLSIRFTIAALLVGAASAQFGGGMPPKKTFSAIKAEVKYIGCDTCMEMVEDAHAQAAVLREEAKADGQKLEEEKVYTMLESVCVPKKKEGRWMTKLDLVDSKVANVKKDKSLLSPHAKGISKEKLNKDTYLLIKKHDSFGHCEKECMTVAKSCVDMTDEQLDMDELAVKLWGGKVEPRELAGQICAEQCDGKRPPMKKERKKDYEFKPKTEEEIQMEEMMAGMEAAGMGGMNMYNRDDMADMMAGMEDEYGIDPSMIEGGMEDMDMGMGGADAFGGMGDLGGEF